MDLDSVCETLRIAHSRLARRNADEKNRALLAVASALDADRKAILEANGKDVERERARGMKESLIARLALNDKGLDDIISSLKVLVEQTDPVGQVIDGWKVPNGLEITQVRVPLGVAAVIYESRPNVTVDVFALAYKSGNAVLLRGSSSALDSNRAIVKAIKKGLASSGGEVDAVALCDTHVSATDASASGHSSAASQGAVDSHADVDWILNAVGKIDIALPRGGAALIKRVVENARIPVIETGSGVCHAYVDTSANAEMAVRIIENSKIQKPGACNSLECLLVHSSRAREILPLVKDAFVKYEAKTGRSGGVELRCDERAYEILAGGASAGSGASAGAANVVRATSGDWGFEFLDYILAVKVVDSIDEAIAYINAHNTKHSDVIVTESREMSRIFRSEVDSACVYVNASIRFTDGGEFGLGAELGISTQKLHARGPMGLTALTTIKYLIDGEGQVRP
jgi:glutamate-5-semialdehyde dehydrogenase